VIEAARQELEVGAHVLANQLRELGYVVDDSVPQAVGNPAQVGFVQFDYTIKLGGRRGEVVQIGFIAPNDFPVNPPGGIYVKGELRPISSDSALPHGGVSDATTVLGARWRYWSRTHDTWNRSPRDAAAWMKHVDRLFLDL
jgi:hypothetical protein